MITFAQRGFYDDLQARSDFFSTYSNVTAGLHAFQIAGVPMKSTSEIDTQKFIGNIPMMREWSGPIFTDGFHKFQTTVKNTKYGLALPIKDEDFKFDKLNLIKRQLGSLAGSTARHWDELLINRIEAGTTDTGYDGLPLYSASHIEGKQAAVQKNLLTATEVPALNVSTAAAPTAAELSRAIFGMIEYMKGWVDDHNQPINDHLTNFTVLMPTNFWQAALELKSSMRILEGGESANNLLLSQSDVTINLMSNNRLSSTTAIYIIANDYPLRSFFLQEVGGLDLQYLGPDSEHFTLHDEHLYRAKAWRGVGYGPWQGTAKGTFS